MSQLDKHRTSTCFNVKHYLIVLGQSGGKKVLLHSRELKSLQGSAEG